MTQSADPWIDLQPLTYELDGTTHYFNGVEVSSSGSNRVAPRARPYQPGEKLDTTGPNGTDRTIRAIFSRDVVEAEQEGNADARWPDDLEALEDAFLTGKTGTLNLPWRRGIRCKPLTWQRQAFADQNRSGETLTVNFKDDNEDDLDREAFQRVSVRSTAQSSVEATSFDLESEGGWDGSIEDITQLAADLEGLMNAPADVLAAIQHVGNRILRACDTVVNALPAKGLGGPEGAGMRQKLLELQDLVAGAVGEAQQRQRRTRAVRYQRATDIHAVATEHRQSARDLMTINPDIPDFGFIAAGTPIYIYAE